MLLRDLLLKIVICSVLLVALIGCQQSPTGAVVVEEPEAKHVVVKSAPVSEPEPEDIVIEEEPVWVPENVLPPAPKPEVIVIPEDKPSNDPVGDCLRSCTSSCEKTAKNACSQSSGSTCKHLCGDIIDPSACSTACSLRNARICEPKMLEFCTAQCNSKCY